MCNLINIHTYIHTYRHTSYRHTNIQAYRHTYIHTYNTYILHEHDRVDFSPVVTVCVVVVFFPFILDIKFVGRTSRGHTGGRSHRITSHPPFFCGACLNFSREKDSAIIPFPRRP